MIRINLLPVKQLKAEISRRREIVLAVSCLTAVLFALGGLYMYQFRRVSFLERELAELRLELQQFTAKAKGVADLQQRIKEYQGKHKVIADINKKKSGPVRVMESLSASTPAALWLTQFKETGGDLTITGVAMDNQTIVEFLQALDSHPNFRNTELVETVQSDQTGVPQRRFLIRAKLLYQPPTQTAVNEAAPTLPAAKNN